MYQYQTKSCDELAKLGSFKKSYSTIFQKVNQAHILSCFMKTDSASARQVINGGLGGGYNDAQMSGSFLYNTYHTSLHHCYATFLLNKMFCFDNILPSLIIISIFHDHHIYTTSAQTSYSLHQNNAPIHPLPFCLDEV